LLEIFYFICHRDTIAGKVDVGHFQRGDNFVKPTEMLYETFLRYQNEVEDFLPDKGSCEETSNLDSEDESQADGGLWQSALVYIIWKECYSPRPFEPLSRAFEMIDSPKIYTIITPLLLCLQ